ncbi:MAG TPA: hypothetical protein VE152_00035 [Acidimicrobiales bacterium]|nr:hypothetical protein [Acidimicrobiales bacterium]
MKPLRRILVGGAAVAATVGLTAAPALAQTGHQANNDPHSTLYVSHSATTGAQDTSCATAAYSHIEKAVRAASSGDTVYLCGATPYVQRVFIKGKDLNLTGDPGATVKVPANPPTPKNFFTKRLLQTPNSIVTVLGKADVAVKGLTIKGPFQNVGPAGEAFGVLQLGKGNVRLEHDQVLNIRAANQAAFGGDQYGMGVAIGARSLTPQSSNVSPKGNFVGHGEVFHTVIKGYQKNGLRADGPGTWIEAADNTVNGGGPTTKIARNGIEFLYGATGKVADNTVTGNEYSAQRPTGGASSSGILVFGGYGLGPLSKDVQIHKNDLHNNDVAVYVAEGNAMGKAPNTPTDIHIDNNCISKTNGQTNMSGFTAENPHLQYTAYQVGIADSGNGDHIDNNCINGTVVNGKDTAYGPQTKPMGPFLAPIDIQTYPPKNVHVHNNYFDGSPTNPPY